MPDKTPAPATVDSSNRKMLFDARVQPFWLWHRNPRKILGLFDAEYKKRRRYEAIVRAIGQGLQEQGIDPAGWDQRDGECVCNLKVDRLGVLQDLRMFAGELDQKSTTDIYEGKVDSRFVHLIRNRDRDAFYLPIDFPEPMLILEHETREYLPVGSAVRLQRELDLLNREIRIEKTFKLKGMVDFFQAGDEEIRQFDLRFGNDPQFWMKFSFVLLQKLAKKSVECGFPILFS